MVCVSCKNEHIENFCPNCGERADVPKITFKSMFAEAFSTITNMDKGFLLNLKSLTLNPKELITSYLQGKRKGIFNPISFLIISVTIYLIIDSFMASSIEDVASNNSSRPKSKIYLLTYEAGYFIASYLKYFWLLTIFWFGISTKIIFGKYDYAEHLTISSFIIGYATLFGLIGLLFFDWSDLLFNPFVYLSFLLILYQLFKDEKDKTETIVLSFLSVILFIIQLILIIVVIGLFRTYK